MKTMANKPNDKATHKQRESGKRKVQDQFNKKNTIGDGGSTAL